MLRPDIRYENRLRMQMCLRVQWMILANGAAAIFRSRGVGSSCLGVCLLSLAVLNFIFLVHFASEIAAGRRPTILGETLLFMRWTARRKLFGAEETAIAGQN